MPIRPWMGHTPQFIIPYTSATYTNCVLPLGGTQFT